MFLNATLVFILTLLILLAITRVVDYFDKTSPQFQILSQYFEYVLIGLGGLGLIYWIGVSLAALVQMWTA